ncbi:MAG TPA: hypothetical protein VFV34_06870 [Blastocatellia bacterium]|nr:hypothetical protein [Blastocatellia bacterium]
MMSRKLIAIIAAVVVISAGFLIMSGGRSSGEAASSAVQVPAPSTSAAPTNNDPNSEQAYLADFKAGYADGFATGAVGYNYPDQGTLAGRTGGYLAGLEQGYTDGQNNQGLLQDRLCGVGSARRAPSESGAGYAPSSSRGTSRVLGSRAYNTERVDNGLGSGTRKAILIAGGAAAGAGLGAAIGGRKGAAIGALAGGGTGTALALTNNPKRAFNRRVSGKSLALRTAIGAGAGAAVGALVGGKRGAGAGAALGGGGGALWSLLDGQRTRP